MTPSPALRIALAQENLLVGDIDGNTQRIIETATRARHEAGAGLVVFPELSLTGYPLEDLLMRESLQTRVDAALELIAASSRDVPVVVGYPRHLDGVLYNAAGFFAEGRLQHEYFKQKLPNYQVFDEKRYFRPGTEPCVFEFHGLRIGLAICEDLWKPDPVQQARQAGAQLILGLNASPFHAGKLLQRREVLRDRIRECGIPLAYVNLLGGQDELVFDGGSMVLNGEGEVVHQASQFVAGYSTFDVLPDASVHSELDVPPLAEVESVYEALKLGVRDYVDKNGFKGVVLGLSGGIDSALTLAVAADAIGPERVEAMMMPFRYTSDMSRNDACEQADAMGATYRVISIEPMYEAFMAQLQSELGDGGPDTTEQNLQSRCRGVVLMALSNRKGTLVLTTGNKSEMAVGYATLYGDMAGGYGVLKDVPKTLVYELSRYRNSISPVIPERVIERPPSAELAPDQEDTDSLPPYDVLDPILELYVENDLSAEAIVARGFDRDTVYRVLRMIDLNEYKRRQAPVGVRITARGFGRDRRYPITNGWRIGE